MFWASFKHNIKTDLVIIEGDLESVQGGVIAKVYLSVLEEYLPTIFKPSDTFIQDSASIHKARLVQNWFAEEGYILIVWLVYSSDLNPIKNLWAILKTEIWKQYLELEFCTKTDTNIKLLCNAARACWDGLQAEILVKLSTKMKDRVDAVLKAERWYTKY
jgi:hypothetical protein